MKGLSRRQTVTGAGDETRGVKAAAGDRDGEKELQENRVGGKTTVCENKQSQTRISHANAREIVDS